jgi:hypothetical protein
LSRWFKKDLEEGGLGFPFFIEEARAPLLKKPTIELIPI